MPSASTRRDLGGDGAGVVGGGEAEVLGADADGGGAGGAAAGGRKFIAGAPMKPATKRLAGRL